MAQYQVTCVTPDSSDVDRRIDALGGPGWYKPIDDIIRDIDRGDTYWVSVRGRHVIVIVRTHPSSGRRYLTTEADGFPPNNLLFLPACR